MRDNLIHVDVDVVGEQTGERYQGKFVLKKFLTLGEQNEAAKVSNRLTLGFDKPASVNPDRLALILSKYVDGETQANMFGELIGEFSITDPQYEMTTVLCYLNSHIVESPDWWQPKESKNLGGLDLIDTSPMQEINDQLFKARAEHKKALTPAPAPLPQA